MVCLLGNGGIFLLLSTTESGPQHHGNTACVHAHPSSWCALLNESAWLLSNRARGTNIVAITNSLYHTKLSSFGGLALNLLSTHGCVLFCWSWKTCKMRWSSAAMLRPEIMWRTSIWRSSLSCISTTDLPLAFPDRSCAMPSRCSERQMRRAGILLTETNCWSYCRLEVNMFSWVWTVLYFW